jgi:hypothetical protein
VPENIRRQFDAAAVVVEFEHAVLGGHEGVGRHHKGAEAQTLAQKNQE